MDDLNSILIEGRVSGELSIVNDGGIRRASFLLRSRRARRVGKDTVDQNTRIRAVLYKSRLIEGAIIGVRDERRLRIIGRLTEDAYDGGICINVEHIEYRPEL